ncbi:MAG: YihY/virulence factor BrkB family protein [Rhodocyclaceae bacterium]|jgi:membrane protein|nr:YihY/virulence factor BrkB family protein [Rhodocyclaceae bacterium]
MIQKILQPVLYVFNIIRDAVRIWLEANAFVFSAALAFFTVFSIAPVVIIAVTLVGMVLGEQAAAGEIAQQLETTLGRQAAEAVQTAVASSQITESGLMPTLIGFAAMAFGATTVFAQMQISLNAIWGVAPKPSRNSVFIFIKNRVLSLTVVLAIGFVLLVSMLLGVALRMFTQFAGDWMPVPPVVLIGFEMVVAFAVMVLLFSMIFRILPDVLLEWRDVLTGAVVTAVLFSIGRALIGMYLAKTATASTYGAAGSLVVLLLWVNYSALILLFGAALTRATVQARGQAVRPRVTAVRVHRELIEDDVPAPGQAEESRPDQPRVDEAQAEKTARGAAPAG